jgi:hypothetical protein
VSRRGTTSTRWPARCSYGSTSARTLSSSPDQPGGVITRLSEHRGPDDLAEIAEVLEDAYRSVVE